MMRQLGGLLGWIDFVFGVFFWQYGQQVDVIGKKTNLFR